MGQLARKGIIQELRRRRVFNTAALYIVGAWVVLQVADLAFESWDIASAALRYVWLGAILGFPIALVFGWRYDITKHGIVRTPPADLPPLFDQSLQRTDHVILAVLVAIAGGIFYQLTIQVSDTQYQKSVAVVPQDADPNTIAVLPLENLSGDPEQAYFVSGMQDALIGGLSRISALKVTSKTSTLRYRETTESLPAIAAQLGVAKLIEGSVFRIEDRVRINVTLINALLDEHIWSKSFERDVRDVMFLQNELAGAIAQQVEVTLKPHEQDQLEQAESINPAAYEAYLKGQFHWQRFTPQDMKLADQFFQQAVNLDPDNALAHAGLATLCAIPAQMELIRPQVAREQCLPLIMKALDVGANLPEAHFAYAIHVAWLLYNWEEGEAAFERAIELNPSYAMAHLLYSHLLTLTGRIEEGTEQMRLAVELDPLNPFVQGAQGAQLMLADDLQGAIRVTEELLASTPGFGFGYSTLIRTYHFLGEKDKAIAALAEEHRIFNDPEAAMAIESTYAESGYVAAWLSNAQWWEEAYRTDGILAVGVGHSYEFAGEAEKAIDWYETAFRIAGPNVPYLGAKVKTPAIQSNPRFIKLLRELKLDYWADKYAQLGRGQGQVPES